MNNKYFLKQIFSLITGLVFYSGLILAGTEGIETAQIKTDVTYQTITGFGASLAYYENWLTAHPNKSEIYSIIFKELSLDILRVRNAYDYDATMIGRVKEFANAAKQNLGYPIDIMITSWGPPAYLKSNNDRNNGGTLKYSVSNGKVNFDYAGFAKWWNKSLNEYNYNGIYPMYISIQNEPDWKASYESCLMKPSETINSTDTIAGYNKALIAVYDTINQRENTPKLLGSECIGIGYDAVENYVNALDLSKIVGIAHHLYHGAEGGTVENDPFTSINYKKVGNCHPEVPHFQTEYSRAGWFTLAGMMFQSFAEENTTAFLYWDLIWTDGAGLVNLDFPWDRSRWSNSKGYSRTKDYYVFKQYSAFIHPGWKRASSTLNNTTLKTVAFISAEKDSAVFVAINLLGTVSQAIQVTIPGYSINESSVYKTSETKDCELSGSLNDSVFTAEPHSITTIKMSISKNLTGLNDKKGIGINKTILCSSNYPNPFNSSTTLRFSLSTNQQIWLSVFDYQGKNIERNFIGFFPSGSNQIVYNRNGLNNGLYFYKIENADGEFALGRFMIKD